MAVAFQLGIGNNSPTITYSPFFPNTVAQNATAGWTPYYTISGFPWTSALVGYGTSLQISSKNDSFLSVTWFGTGIDLYGNATNAAFQVSLDRKTGGGSSGNALIDPSSNLLASFSNLPLDTYTVTLIAGTSSSPSSFIAFDRAVITSALEVTDLDSVTVHSETVDDSSIAYNGQWTSQESSTPGRSIHVTTRSGDSAQLTFNGTAVSVYGHRNPAAGFYNVTLDGQTTQYNAESVWNEGAVLFYATGLDPERTHSLSITNAANGFLGVEYINTTFISGTSTQSSGSDIPKDAIAGIVLGIVLGVVAFPILVFFLWRRRRRRRRNRRDITFIEPSIHKGFNKAEVFDVQPGSLGQRGKSPTQSPISEISLELLPVTLPQVAHPRSKPSPPTFPRSPTASSPSTTQRQRDNGSGSVIHPPEAVDQCLGVQIRNPLQDDLESTPSPVLNRRGTVPKPSGPRPPSYRFSADDPRTPFSLPLVQTLADPTPTEGKEPPEPETQQLDEGGRTTIYSFLDMSSFSAPSSTIDDIGQSHNPDRPTSPANPEPPRHPPVAGADSTQSHRSSNKRRESGISNPLTLSVVIQQPPTLRYPPSTEPHPYSPYSTGHRLTPQFLRPRTGEGASPTESIPFSTSEISEIRFRHPGEGGETGSSRPGSGSGPQLSLKSAAPTSPIYRKLFGATQGEEPPDGLLEKKRPFHRKALSSPTFSTPPRP